MARCGRRRTGTCLCPPTFPLQPTPRLGMHGKWATRPITGAMGTVGPRRLWMSEVRDLVEGAALTPFVRVAAAADFASPFANAGDHGLGYINSDVTLYLHRLPVKEWIGFEVVNHHATDGIAIGECFLRPQGPVLGRWRAARVHFAVRRQHRGLRDAG